MLVNRGHRQHPADLERKLHKNISSLRLTGETPLHAPNTEARRSCTVPGRKSRKVLQRATTLDGCVASWACGRS